MYGFQELILLSEMHREVPEVLRLIVAIHLQRYIRT